MGRKKKGYLATDHVEPKKSESAEKSAPKASESVDKAAKLAQNESDLAKHPKFAKFNSSRKD